MMAAATTPNTAIDIGNRAFLDAIFPDLRKEEYLWTAQFKTSPTKAKIEQWAGLPVSDHYQDRNKQHADWNHYFCVSSLVASADGSKHRRKANFSRLFMVVLDDASPVKGIEPTYVLETSQGKMQVGYRLTTPLDDLDQAVALHKALADAGHLGADKNGNNPVRYVRLPWGANTKYQPAHEHRMLHWAPDKTIALDDLDPANLRAADAKLRYIRCGDGYQLGCRAQDDQGRVSAEPDRRRASCR